MRRLTFIHVAVLWMLFGCASGWETARKTNSIEGYLAFNKQNPSSPNVEDSRREIRALLAQYLKGVRTLSLAPDPGKPRPTCCELQPIESLIRAALAERGYDASAPSREPNQLVFSVSQEKIFFGTSRSYWHPALMTSIQITLQHSTYGPLFVQNYSVLAESESRTVKLSDIRVVPLDPSQRTFINPKSGGAWGFGVEFVLPDKGPNATTTEKELQEAYWARLFSLERFLVDFQRQIKERGPLDTGESTKWLF